MKWKIFVLIIAGLLPEFGFAVRLKDLASIRGVRDNQLVGYGMVTGLNGTGDRGGDFTDASLLTALKGLGVDMKGTKVGAKNAAAVMVSAVVPPFTRMGAHLDVVVSSIGSATSIEGGTLLVTALKGADGKVYAIAQGHIATPRRGDRGVTTPQANLTVQVSDAAILEKDVAFDFTNQKEIRYQLHQADFTTSARIAERVNEELGGKYATALDPGTIQVLLPYTLDESPVNLVAKIESLDVEPDNAAKVIINRRTGTVVLGDNVRIYPVAIAHNNLHIQVREDTRKPASLDIPPPAPPTEAPPVVQGTTPDAPPAAVAKTPKKITVSNQGPSIADIMISLNEVGASPDDMFFILKALKDSGALVAEIESR